MAGLLKKKDEDEKIVTPKAEEKTPSEAAPAEAAPAPTPEPKKAEAPEPAAPAPAKTQQEQQADAKMKTLEAARKANEQGFRRTVQEHAKTVETTIEEPGELTLPENMEKHRETLEKSNAAGKMGNGTTFGYAVNQIGVDVASIKDEQQLAYFATTLHSDKDKRTVMSAWATENGLDPQEVIFHGEELLGSRLFSEPQTAQGGLNVIGLVDRNGKKLDLRSADFASVVHAAKSIPDKTIRKQAFSYIEDLTKVRGGRFYGQSLDGVDQGFIDTLDFPQESYDDFVDGLNFYGDQGREEENLRRYMAAYDSIHGEGSLLSGAQKKWYQQALDDSFRSKTGAKAAPDAEMARAALGQLDAARDAQAQREAEPKKEDEPGFLESLGESVKDLWNRMTGGDEEAMADMPEPRLVASASPVPPARPREDQDDALEAAESETAEGSAAAEPGEKQGPVYQPEASSQIVAQAMPDVEQASEKIDLTGDIATALEYSHTGRADELDDATLAVLDGLYKSGDNGVRTILRMADPEFYAAYETGNDAPESMWQRRTGDVLGSKVEKYVRRIYGEDFPKELYGDAVMALVGVVEAANADGTFTEDDRIAWEGSRVAWYVDKHPEALAPVEEVFAQLEGMRQDAEANEAAILAERDAELERDRQAVAIGQASEIQYQNVLRHAPQMDNAMGMRDPTYAEMYDQITMMFWDAAGNWGDDSPAFMDTYVYKTMKARGVQDLESGESEYEMLLYGTMESMLLDDMRVASSLGKTLGEYYDARGGMSAEDICERASAEIVRMGGETSEEEVAAVQQTIADEAEKAGLGWAKTAEVGAKLGHETVKEGRYESFLMVAAATDIPRDVARISTEFNQMYGFWGATAYKKEMYAYARSGKLPQELSEHIIGYLDEGGDPYQLGIHPGDNGWAVDGYAKAQERIATYQKMIEAEATEGEKKAAQYISGAIQNTELMGETTVMSMLLSAFGPVGSYAALRTVYGSANQGKSMSDYMAGGYTLRESLALSGARATGEALANMTTLGHLTDSLKGYSALLSKGLTGVGGVGNPKVVSAFMTGMKSFFGEIAEETVKDPLLEGVYGDAMEGAVKSAIDDGKINPVKNIVAGVSDAVSGLPETVSQMISDAPQTIMATIPFALLGAGGDVIRNSQSAKAARDFIENPTAQTAKAVENAIAQDAQDGRFIDAMRKAQRDAEVETETAANLLLDPEPTLYEKAQKTREQADSHKTQMDASQTRIEEGWAAYDEGEASGDVNEQLAALETIAKAEQGLAEHTREYEQKNLEAKNAKRELENEARSRAVAEVNARHARQKAELTAELAARETPEKKMEAIEKELDAIDTAFIGAEDAGDEAQSAELQTRQDALLAQMETVGAELQAQQDQQDAEAEAALAQVQAATGDTSADAYVTDVTRGTSDPVKQRIASELKKNTGVDLVTANLVDGVRGWYDRKNNQLVLSNKLGAGETERVVVMHELTHYIENSPGYEAYKSAVLEAAYEGGEEYRAQMLERDREDLKEQYAAHGVTLNDSDVDAELVAAATERVIGGDEGFFESLIAGGKTSLLRRVYMKVRNFLARRKAKKASKEMLAQYDAMAKARDLMEKALKEAPRGAQADGKTQYAIVQDESNWPMVKADRPLNLGEKASSWNDKIQKVIRDTIREHGDVQVRALDGETLYITEKSQWHAGSWPERFSKKKYSVKVNASAHLDEVAAVSYDQKPGKKNEPDDGRHPDVAPDGWRYRTAVFEDYDGERYELGLSVGENGIVKTVYNIGKVKNIPKENNHPNSVVGSSGGVSSSETSLANTASISSGGNTSVQQNSTGVKNQSTQSGAKYSIGVRQFGNNTMQRADFISDHVKELVRDTEYERDTNREQVQRATQKLDSMGVDAAAADLLGREKKSYTADDNALAFVTMAEATRNGDETTAALLAMRMLEETGEQGRALQSIKIGLKLTPEGVMAETIRKADRANRKRGIPPESFPVGEGAPKTGGSETREDGTTIRTPEEVEAVYRTADEVNAALDALDGDISYDNPWQLPLSDKQMELIRKYKLTGEKLPGANYNVATLKQRMLAAIIAAGPETAGDGQKALCQQLEAMKRGHAVVTKADLTYTAGQMAEFRLREGSEATTPQTQEGRRALGRAYQAQDNVTQEGFFSKWSALRFMNMLSAPATAVRNISSNVLASGLENTATAVAAGIDRRISKKTGNRTTELASKGEKQAGKRAFAAETAQTFEDYFITHADTGHGHKYATGGQGRVFESEFLEGCRNLVDFAMQIGDRPFYERTYAQELSIIKRLGMKATEMQDGRMVSRPMTDAEMHEEATARALKRVFQEDNQIVDALNSIKAKSPEADLFISTLMPFIKTPTNIAMRAIEYSPVGLGITLTRGWINGVDSGKAQAISQRDYVMGIGRGLTGTGLMVAGAALAACGTIGFGRGEEENQKRTGILSALGEPYGMYIQIGDTKHEIDWALPMSSAIAMGAELYKALEDGEGMAEAAISAIINGVGDQIMSTPMLSSMNDIFRGYESTENMVMRLAKTGVSSLINQTLSPAVIRAIAKATDPYVRETGSQNAVMSVLNQNLIQYWPGLRQMLPIKTDLTGDRQLQSGYWNPKGEHGNAMLQMLDSFFTPTATIGEKNDAALLELLDLSYRTDETAFLPELLVSKNKYELKLNKEYAKALGYAEAAIVMELTDAEKRNANEAFGNLLFNGDGGRRYLDKQGMGKDFPGLRAVMEDRALYGKQARVWSLMSDEERTALVQTMRDDAKGLIAMDVARRKKEAGEL